MTDKKLTVEFAPGCFDNFDGTQEELDELVKMIQDMAESGELEEQCRPVDPEELDDETLEIIANVLTNQERKLQ